MLNQIFRRYFGAGASVLASDLRNDLWTSNHAQPQPAYGAADEAALVLEQYKIYVEMADRVSARRGLTNTFFLTLNSAIFAAVGFVWGRDAHTASWLLVFPMIVFVAQCLAWFWLVRSYRQLNTAKYAVIGALEERLPASPYWRAEWKALGEGKDPSRYWPLTHLEQWVPALFAITYLGGFIAVMVT